jgi:phage gpG-like protein
MLTLRWSIEGQQQLVRRLRGIRAEALNWKPAFDEASKDLQGIFANDVFQTEGRAVGKKRWQPLSPAYAARKARLYPGKGILEATGTMRNSFKRKFDPDMAAVWNTAEYFKYHQSNKPRSKMPRRIMMHLGNQQRELVVKIFHQHWHRKMQRVST